MSKKIVCLGWGSLIWDPREFRDFLRSQWFSDGPALPVEFTRISGDQRVTLIIDQEAVPVATLWTEVNVESLDHAKEALMNREGTIPKHIHHIGIYEQADNIIDTSVKAWIQERGFDYAMWTGLSYSKASNGKRPPIEFVLSHLEGLDLPKRRTAFEYIKKAPKQINTEYRRAIVKAFGLDN